MADGVKISELPSVVAANVAETDFLPISGSAADSVTERIAASELRKVMTGGAFSNPASGTGSPEGVRTAAVGALFVQTDGAAGKTLWVKLTGSGNTGWGLAPTYPTRAGELGVVSHFFPYGDVRRYGALGDGTTNDAPAFSAAFQSNSKRVVIPQPTNYYKLAGPVNCTSIANTGGFVVSYEGAMAHAQEAIRIAHNGVGFDCTGAGWFVWNNVSFVNDTGFIPSCGILLARNAAAGAAGQNRFNNVHGRGAFVNGFIYNYGSEENAYNDCYFYGTQVGAPLITIDATNAAGLTSTFETIATGTQSTTVNHFTGGTYIHSAAADVNKTVFRLRGAADLSFRDIFWSAAGGRAIIRVLDEGVGPTSVVVIDSARTEVGGEASYMVEFASTVASVPTNWSITNVRARASVNVIYADDNSDLRAFNYAGISDGLGTGVSVKNASYWNYRGAYFVGRAGGTISRSNFIGETSTWTFSGTQTLNTKIDIDTGAYDFGGSGSAILALPSTRLNDYKADTFTPTVVIGASGAPDSMLVQAGSYTKIGNRVFFDLVVTVGTLGAATGAVTIGGLPYTASNTSGEEHTPSITSADINITGGWLQARILPNTAAIELKVANYGSPQTLVNVTEAHLRQYASLRISGHYRV